NNMDYQTTALKIDLSKAILKKVSTIINEDSLLDFYIQFQENKKSYFLIISNVYYHHKFAAPYLTNYDFFILDSIDFQNLYNSSKNLSKKNVLKNKSIIDSNLPDYDDVYNNYKLVVEPPKPNNFKPEVYEFVEQMPEYPGGEDALYSFININLRYPELAKQNNIEGQVTIGFIVNEDGSLSDFKVLRGMGYGCDEEAIRVIKMMPKWRSGKQNGMPVKVKYQLPVVFTIKD
ncbi:MAG: energy transducer TonB, partial [Chitinophagaceae bacterium]|nr:energy transducer TonB [Chitinophagaceae bacterium]